MEEKQTTNYIDNAKLYDELVAMRAENEERVANGERPIISNSIGGQILQICTGLSYRWNYINYHFRDDMVNMAAETCIRYIWNFDPEKSQNPFGFFTMVASRVFVKKIQAEKKLMNHKIEYIEQQHNMMEDITMDSVDDEIMGIIPNLEELLNNDIIH